MSQIGTCSYSKCTKTFKKRNYRQHACCPSHRTLSNREKGKAKPNPYSKKKASSSLKNDVTKSAITAAFPSLISGANTGQIFATAATAVVTNSALPRVLEGIDKGSVNPIAAGAGAAGGYFISGYFTKSPLLRLLAALAAGWGSNSYYNMVLHSVEPNSAAAQIFSQTDSSGISPSELTDIIHSRDYRSLSIPSYEFSNSYSALFGNPSTDFYMMVHGLPGQGKTHWVVKFAEYFNRNHNSVLYYAAEQNGISKSFQDIQNKVKTSFDIHTRPENVSKDEMIQHFNHYGLVVIDSVNALGLSHEDIKEIRDKTSSAVVVVLQSNKEGNFKGAQNWKHDVDISLRMEARNPVIEKSRFGGSQDLPKGKVVNM